MRDLARHPLASNAFRPPRETLHPATHRHDARLSASFAPQVRQRFPSHAVFGEEGGSGSGGGGSGEWTWVLDPIDGTKSFITGKPLFGTLIALVHNESGTPVLGLIDQPILRERRARRARAAAATSAGRKILKWRERAGGWARRGRERR